MGQAEILMLADISEKLIRGDFVGNIIKDFYRDNVLWKSSQWGLREDYKKYILEQLFGGTKDDDYYGEKCDGYKYGKLFDCREVLSPEQYDETSEQYDDALDEIYTLPLKYMVLKYVVGLYDTQICRVLKTDLVTIQEMRRQIQKNFESPMIAFNIFKPHCHDRPAYNVSDEIIKELCESEFGQKTTLSYFSLTLYDREFGYSQLWDELYFNYAIKTLYEFVHIPYSVLLCATKYNKELCDIDGEKIYNDLCERIIEDFDKFQKGTYIEPVWI